MLKSFRAGAMAVALLYAGVGVAAANPVCLDSVPVEITTPDGWQLGITLADMKIESVPNMGATAFTREGYVDATARMNINGKGSRKVTLGSVSLWYQASCQINVPSGLTLNPSPSAGIGASVSSSVPTGSTSIGLQPSVSANPQTAVVLQPGNINQTPLGKKAFQADDFGDMETNPNGFEGVVSVQHQNVHVDNCAGPVFVRLHAQATINTAHSDDAVDAYSVILPL